MTFEYWVIDLRHDETTVHQLEEELASNGDEGWELVSVVDNGHRMRLFFKREKKKK